MTTRKLMILSAVAGVFAFGTALAAHVDTHNHDYSDSQYSSTPLHPYDGSAAPRSGD